MRLDGEVTALLLFTAAAAGASAQSGRADGAGTLLSSTAFLALCLSWRLLAPRSWARWRAPLLVTLRLLLAAPAAVPLLKLSRTRAAAPRAADVIDGLLGSLHFGFVLLVASGTAGLVLVGCRWWWAPWQAGGVQHFLQYHAAGCPQEHLVCRVPANDVLTSGSACSTGYRRAAWACDCRRCWGRPCKWSPPRWSPPPTRPCAPQTSCGTLEPWSG